MESWKHIAEKNIRDDLIQIFLFINKEIETQTAHHHTCYCSQDSWFSIWCTHPVSDENRNTAARLVWRNGNLNVIQWRKKSHPLYILKSNRKTQILKLFLNKILSMDFIQYWYILWPWGIFEYLFVIVKYCIWIMYNKMLSKLPLNNV